jgi:polyhydroxyalkanoate synthase
MDLSPAYSLVDFFCQQGFEVWNVDLRGYGESRARPVVEGGPSDPLWTFDDHATKDVPAILAHVTQAAGVEAVHWVGHSMGGLVMYAYLGLHPEETRIASLCCIGSPAGLAPSFFNRLTAWIAPLLFAASARFPLRWLARGGALLIPYLPIHLGFCYPPNIDPYVFRRGLYVMTEDFNERITAVFLEMLRSGRFLSADGKVDYLANLAGVRVPLCCIAGEGDTLAPPAQVRLGYDGIGSSCKEFHVVGRSFGAKLNYCHNGLIFAKHVHEEVYPLILRWIEARCR